MPYTVALILIIAGYIWIVDGLVDVRGVWRQVPTVLALGVGVLRAARSGEWGLEPRAFGRAALGSTLLTAAAAAVLAWLGARAGTWHARPEPWLDFAYLLFWGGGQQFLLHTVVLREARQRLPAPAASVVAAAIFAGFHLPNPFLTAATGAAALGWCAIYSRAPNLVPLAVSHAALTLVVLHTLDAETTGHLRTGWNYLDAR